MNIKYSINHFVFFIKDFHLAAYSYRPPAPFSNKSLFGYHRPMKKKLLSQAYILGTANKCSETRELLLKPML